MSFLFCSYILVWLRQFLEKDNWQLKCLLLVEPGWSWSITKLNLFLHLWGKLQEVSEAERCEWETQKLMWEDKQADSSSGSLHQLKEQKPVSNLAVLSVTGFSWDPKRQKMEKGWHPATARGKCCLWSGRPLGLGKCFQSTQALICPPQHPLSLQPGYAIDMLMIPFWRADCLKSSMELAACKGVSIAHFLSSPATQFRFSSLWDMSWCFSLSEDPKTLCWSSFWWPSSCSGLLKEFLGLIRLHWIYSN